MTPAKDQVRVAAAGQAAEWFIANQEPAPDHAQRVAFVAWLKASPIHIEEYLGVALVARDLRAATEGPDDSLESLLDAARTDVSDRVEQLHAQRRLAPPPMQTWNRPRRWAIAAAMIVAAASLAWWMSLRPPGAEWHIYVTQHGEQEMQRLADGSVLHLNTETALEVKFDSAGRNVRMRSGEALFAVMHEDPREFRVVAGDAEIVAVGTQFDVRLKGTTTIVTVIEGQVDVRATAPPGASAVGAMRVPAGYAVQIDRGRLPAQSERVDTRAAVAWLERKIAFQDQPLGEVADEFNRYGVVQFVIEDADLRALRISGVFDAYDANSFAAFLQSLEGVRVERTAREIRVMRQEARQPGEARPAN